MAEKPMLFSSPMVRALLEDRKAMTRRLVKPQPVGGDRIHWDKHAGAFQCGRLRDSENAWREIQCPYGKPSDKLWVRETFCVGWPAGPGRWSAIRATSYPDNLRRAFYRADGDDPPDEPQRAWRPSIHMPRWASRITLEITAVRVEQLRDISETDAKAEGVEREMEMHGRDPRGSGNLLVSYSYLEPFKALWDSLNGKTATWESNPWVWVISFRRIPQPELAQEESRG